MSEIKIFVSCHKDSAMPESSILQAVHAGAELASQRFEKMQCDNMGINISDRNKTYCELTVQYWAWKNITLDYYGFCHYRRYFSFEKEFPVSSKEKIHGKGRQPYSNRESISEYSVSDEKMRSVIEKYDIVTVLRELTDSTVYEQYCQFHHKRDIDRMLGILAEKYPDYVESSRKYMKSREHYFLNMYVMKKEAFYSYMEWLFPLLEEFEKVTDFAEFSERDYRTTAFLAERLFGIYFTFVKSNTALKCCEIPYIVFQNTDRKQKIKPVYKESVNLVFASNNRFASYLTVMLHSVAACSKEKNNYDIVIFHRDISEEHQQTIQRMVTERENISIRFYDVSEEVRGIPFKVNQHLSVETFYRYFILDVMAEYRKVLYLDSDMVAMKDVAELYETDVSEVALAAVKDVDVIGSANADHAAEKYVVETVGVENYREYFQAGVLLLNLSELRKYTSSQELVEVTLKQKWRMLDQDVLNRICQGKVKFLEQNWNVVMNWKFEMKSRMDVIKNVPVSLYKEYLNARKQPYLIHYAGAWKPWTTPDCDFAGEFWRYARETAVYEEILFGNTGAGQNKDDLKLEEYKRKIRLKPTPLTVTVDIRLVNQLLPAGTRRRIFVRAVYRKITGRQ